MSRLGSGLAAVLVAAAAGLLVGLAGGWCLARRDAGMRAPGPARGTLDDEAVRAFFTNHFEDGWRSRRETVDTTRAEVDEALKGFRALLEAEPRQAGVRAAARRDGEDQVREGLEELDVVKLLAGLDRLKKAPPRGLATDGVRFERCFARQAPERLLEIKSFEDLLGKDIGDGATLRFCAGTHDFALGFVAPKSLPRDLTIAGAGMDQTLIVWDGFDSEAPVRNLTLRDCTLSARGSLLRMSHWHPVQMRLDRVRVVGFDFANGDVEAFRAHQLALLAIDSRFEGGYGALPHYGGLFALSTGALLARFERCVISRVWIRVPQDGVVVFADCELDRIYGGDGWIRQGGKRILLEGQPGDLPRLDLDALFPQWREAGSATGRR